MALGKNLPTCQGIGRRSHFSFLAIAVWEERDLVIHATPQARECRGRAVPMGTTSRAVPSPAASQTVVMPIKGTQGMGTTSQASAARSLVRDFMVLLQQGRMCCYITPSDPGL